MTATILVVDDEPDLEALVLQGGDRWRVLCARHRSEGSGGAWAPPDAVSRTTASGRLGGDAVPALVAVEIIPAPAPASISTSQLASSPPAQCARAGIIEIELSGGCRVRVDRDVDGEALQPVLEHLRRR